MRVSVVIPTRNMAVFLRGAIESVRSQTYKDWELHIIDDGSTDSTSDIAAEFRADERVHYWRQEHQERAVARNKGIDSSSGDYVAFLDADDLWQPEKLQKQVAALETHPDAVLCYTCARYMRAGGTLLTGQKQFTAPSGRVLPQLARGNFIPVSSVVARRAALDVTGGFDADPRLTGAEDWDLWLRMALIYPIVAVPEELTLYRLHDTPRSHRLILGGALAVVQKRFADPNFQKLARMTKAEAESYTYLSSAGFATPSITRRERLKLICKGISIGPRCIASRTGLHAITRTLLPLAAIRIFQRIARLGAVL